MRITLAKEQTLIALKNLLTSVINDQMEKLPRPMTYYQKVPPYLHGQRLKCGMKGKGGAPSCACHKPVFPVFFVQLSPKNN